MDQKSFLALRPRIKRNSLITIGMRSANCMTIKSKNFLDLLFLFTFALLACETFDDCPIEINKEFIFIYAFTDIDTVISSENFVYYPEYHHIASEKKI